MQMLNQWVLVPSSQDESLMASCEGVEGPILLYETMLHWVVATQICVIFHPELWGR